MSTDQANSGAVPGWLAAPVAGVVGFAVAPPLVKATVVAVVLAVVLVFALAHGHGMTLRAAGALYAGRAVLGTVKALAIVAVEWPLRGAHRVWVRSDAPLRVELAAARATAATIARVHPRPDVDVPSAEVLALPAAAPQPATASTEPLPSRHNDSVTAA